MSSGAQQGLLKEVLGMTAIADQEIPKPQQRRRAGPDEVVEVLAQHHRAPPEQNITSP
jgi:hypothetical protein